MYNELSIRTSFTMWMFSFCAAQKWWFITKKYSLILICTHSRVLILFLESYTGTRKFAHYSHNYLDDGVCLCVWEFSISFVHFIMLLMLSMALMEVLMLMPSHKKFQRREKKDEKLITRFALCSTCDRYYLELVKRSEYYSNTSKSMFGGTRWKNAFDSIVILTFSV